MLISSQKKRITEIPLSYLKNHGIETLNSLPQAAFIQTRKCKAITQIAPTSLKQPDDTVQECTKGDV